MGGFLGPEGSRRLLTDGWGNPPHSAEGVLGMLVPADVSPLGPAGWASSSTYEEEGWSILGRCGVLVLNAVAAMGQLPVIRQKTPQVPRWTI